MKPAQASSTAKVIAASTILLESENRHAGIVAPDAAALCQLFLSGCMMDRLLAKSAGHPWIRRFWRALEGLTLPGIIDHYWRRKRWLEERCRAAIAEGCGRVVILGAGFDTLGIRLSREFVGVDLIEMDHPATQNAKLRALAIHGVTIPNNLGFTCLDLATEDPPTDLLDDRFTLFILEGVLMYLPEHAVGRLFGFMQSLPRTRAKVLFSFMTKWPDGSSGFRPHSRLIHCWLAIRGEPFTWSIEPERIAGFLAEHGFEWLETALGTTIEGENLVMAASRSPTSQLDSAHAGRPSLMSWAGSKNLTSTARQPQRVPNARHG
jgi:methyltransferase (TIGR00027 family)